jgi:hypothetical protein
MEDRLGQAEPRQSLREQQPQSVQPTQWAVCPLGEPTGPDWLHQTSAVALSVCADDIFNHGVVFYFD